MGYRCILANYAFGIRVYDKGSCHGETENVDWSKVYDHLCEFKKTEGYTKNIGKMALIWAFEKYLVDAGFLEPHKKRRIVNEVGEDVKSASKVHNPKSENKDDSVAENKNDDEDEEVFGNDEDEIMT